jgi:xanthine dehydrogenase YagS FAD-binding subunit
MDTFEHIEASTIEEAARLLKRYRSRASLIAGGTDLLSVLKDRILPVYPGKIINIKAIPGLDYISQDSSGLKIGPLAKLSRLAGSPVVKQQYPVLAQAAEAVATPEIRNVATIGGNLLQDVRCWYYRYAAQVGGALICRRKDKKSPCLAINGDNRYHAVTDIGKCVAVCPSDTAVALAALNAVIQVTGRAGSRLIPVSGLYGPLGNNLEPGEIISGIHIPAIAGESRQSFLKYTLRQPVDFAIVSVASLLRADNGIVQEASIYLGAVSYRPFRATVTEEMIRGRRIDEKLAQEAADAQVAGLKPLGKNAYKVEIARSLIKKALLQQ